MVPDDTSVAILASEMEVKQKSGNSRGHFVGSESETRDGAEALGKRQKSQVGQERGQPT
jgi:hypothetical protein